MRDNGDMKPRYIQANLLERKLDYRNKKCCRTSRGPQKCSKNKKNLVKGMNHKEKTFKYLRDKILKLSEAKVRVFLLGHTLEA